MIKPDDVVVEVGANIGAHTVFLAQHVGPGGIILAFEPQRVIFQTLCANIALNNLTNVACFQQALADAPGQIVVPSLDYQAQGNFGGLALGAFVHGESVPVVTLDSLELRRCDFLKVDVEGMEQAVLQGARQTIARLQPVLYVENDRPEKSNTLVRCIDSLGYTMYWHRPLMFNPHNFFGSPENVFGNTASFNMLCISRSSRRQVVGLEPVSLSP